MTVRKRYINVNACVVSANSRRIYIGLSSRALIPAEIRMEVASSRPDYLPTLSAAKTSKLYLLVKHHILAIDEAS